MSGGDDSTVNTGLHVSANQWRTGLIKACIGARVVRGVAEDVADACLALLAQHHDPLSGVLDDLDRWNKAGAGMVVPTFQSIKNHCRCDTPVATLGHGPSIIDLAQAGRTVDCIVDDVGLALGFAQSRHHSHGAVFEVQIGDADIWQPVGEAIRQTVESSGATRLVLRLQSQEKPARLDLTQLPQPVAGEWLRLQELTKEIMVPADSTNRADAGAGLTDND